MIVIPFIKANADKISVAPFVWWLKIKFCNIHSLTTSKYIVVELDTVIVIILKAVGLYKPPFLLRLIRY